jgi:kanamycin nucleotidyltransferase
MQTGPQPFTHDEHLARAEAIAAQFRAKFGRKIRAIGLYGSVAKGTDRPYSDIEIVCIVKGNHFEQNYEWCEGSWKAEVNLLSLDVLQSNAAEFEETWSLTHSAYVHILPLRDPGNLFPGLRELVFGHSSENFSQLMADTIVWEAFELLGKIRNAQHSGQVDALPAQVIGMAKTGAYLIGLDNRHLYSTSSQMFSESLFLPNRPGGYDELCRAAMRGELSEPVKLFKLTEDFWQGIETWAQERKLPVYRSLDNIF